MALLPRVQHKQAAGAGRAELLSLLPQHRGHCWVPYTAGVPQGISTLPGQQQAMVRGRVPPGTVPWGLCAVSTLVSQLPGIPARGLYRFESWCFASGALCLRGTLYLDEGQVTEPGTAQEAMTSPEQVLWGDTCPQGGERETWSCPQGPLKVMCQGGCRKSRATRGRSRFITCHGMTVGDWSHTSFSGESGQTYARSPP